MIIIMICIVPVCGGGDGTGLECGDSGVIVIICGGDNDDLCCW